MKETKVKLTPEIKSRAKTVFKQISEQILWVNVNGVFFTSKNLALNSVKNDSSEVRSISREQLSGSDTTPTKKLIIPTVEGIKIAFIELKEGDHPEKGDKAKIGNKNAQGVFKIDPQTSFKFDKGVLADIINEDPKN